MCIYKAARLKGSDVERVATVNDGPWRSPTTGKLRPPALHVDMSNGHGTLTRIISPRSPGLSPSPPTHSPRHTSGPPFIPSPASPSAPRQLSHGRIPGGT